MSGSKIGQDMSGSIECLVSCENQLHTFARSRLLGVQLIQRMWCIRLQLVVTQMAIVRCNALRLMYRIVLSYCEALQS